MLPRMNKSRSQPTPVRFTVITAGASLAYFFLSWLTSHPAIWNCVGAVTLALGGVFGARAAFHEEAKSSSAASWACIIIGSAAIAGASLAIAIEAFQGE